MNTRIKDTFSIKIETQKRIIKHRMREFLIFELNCDGIMDLMKKNGIDIDKRIDKYIEDMSEYLDNILLASYDYYTNQSNKKLSMFKVKKVNSLLEEGISVQDICETTRYPMDEVITIYKKLLQK